MSTTVIVDHPPRPASKGRRAFRYVNLAPAALGLVTLVGLYSFWRAFQQVFGRSAGLDSTAPDVEQIWIPLLEANIARSLIA